MRLLSKKQTRDRVGIGFSQMARLEKRKRFPQRVRIGFRVFYVDEEIDEFIRERIAERDDRLLLREQQPNPNRLNN